MSIHNIKLGVTRSNTPKLNDVERLLGDLQSRSFNFLFFSFENIAGTKSILQQIEKCS